MGASHTPILLWTDTYTDNHRDADMDTDNYGAADMDKVTVSLRFSTAELVIPHFA